jgi:hypothetical protein
MRMLATLLFALASLPNPGTAAGSTGGEPTPSGVDRLAVSFFTANFLADVAARIEAARIVEQRLAGGYLQEDTGLIWARQDNGTDLDWYAADEHCQDLEIADWMDWRMPTIDELERLHDRRSNASYKLPPEIRLTGCCPWSQSRSGDSSAWNFSFRYRKRFSGSLNYSYELRALCVRAATAEDLLFYEQAAEEAEEEKKRRRKRS